MTDAPTPPKNIPLPASTESSSSSPPNDIPICDCAPSNLSPYNENESSDFHTALTNQPDSTHHAVPIHDHSTSSLDSYDEDESLDFHTALTIPPDPTNDPINNELVYPNFPPGSQDNPIDVDQVSPVSCTIPNDPTIDGFLHYLKHEVYIVWEV